MHALARLRLWDGSQRELAAGELIGRLRTASLQVDDPLISEAHAMVSLRGGELKLLALRRPVAVKGKPVGELPLHKGQRFELAPGLEVEVLEVRLPDEVLAIEAPGLPRQVLPGVCSVLVSPRLHLVPKYQPQAAVWIHTDGPSWTLRLPDGSSRPLRDGDTIEVPGHTLRAVAVPLGQAGQDATRLEGGVQEPLHLQARFDSVHIHCGRRPPLVLAGLSARLVSELVSFEAPVDWEVLARQVWSDEPDRGALRRKLDVTLNRLRGKLRDARIRPDLLRSDGTGLIELVLYDGDRVEDLQ